MQLLEKNKNMRGWKKMWGMSVKKKKRDWIGWIQEKVTSF